MSCLLFGPESSSLPLSVFGDLLDGAGSSKISDIAIKTASSASSATFKAGILWKELF